ncbi:MAG: hypothetical protein ACSLEN_12625 [Candidatus Malihini olakiniferum]
MGDSPFTHGRRSFPVKEWSSRGKIMKELINKVDDVVREQLEGFALAHPELTVNTEPFYIYRRSDKPKVELISGRSSWHGADARRFCRFWYAGWRVPQSYFYLTYTRSNV